MKKSENKIEEYPVGSILGQEELDAVRRVIESGTTLTRGPDVELFEKEFADYIGVEYGVACNSGTSALELIFSAIDVCCCC